MKFFKDRKLGQKDLTWICKALDLTSYWQRSFIIKEGEESDRFFIILKGKCSVWIPVRIEDMLKPIIQFRNAVAEAVEQDEGELTYEYNFHLDPYKTCD